nr:MAG: hypothetical protein DIU64_09125 [Caldicoprobacter oshimai]
MSGVQIPPGVPEKAGKSSFPAFCILIDQEGFIGRWLGVSLKRTHRKAKTLLYKNKFAIM